MSALPAVQPLLQTVLQRPDVWRGDRCAVAAEAGVASGFAALDADARWRLAAWSADRAARRARRHRRTFPAASGLVPVRGAGAGGAGGTTFAPHAPAWAGVLPLERLLLVDAGAADAPRQPRPCSPAGRWGPCCCGCRTRSSRACCGVCSWRPKGRARRLPLRAEKHAGTASPAPLRLVLAGSAQGLQARILKRRGPPCVAPLCLAVARPVEAERLAIRLPPARQAALHAVPA